MSKKVGLFGGTFDPVHNGHIAIARSFLDSGFIDELWILPSPSPPHKSEKPVTPLADRKRMLELAFSGFENVQISEIEATLPLPSYTIQTIQFLKEYFPETRFYLCIGGDSLEEFETWHQPDEILNETELLVAERPDTDYHDLPETVLAKVHFIDHQPVDVSSTELRNLLKNEGELDEMIPEEVNDYIRKKGLYRNQKNRLK